MSGNGNRYQVLRQRRVIAYLFRALSLKGKLVKMGTHPGEFSPKEPDSVFSFLISSRLGM